MRARFVNRRRARCLARKREEAGRAATALHLLVIAAAALLAGCSANQVVPTTSHRAPPATQPSSTSGSTANALRFEGNGSEVSPVFALTAVQYKAYWTATNYSGWDDTFLIYGFREGSDNSDQVIADVVLLQGQGQRGASR